MAPRGGTEILYANLKKYIGPEYLHKINLIVSQSNYESLHPNLPNVQWQHLNTDELNTFGLRDKSFVDRIDKFVFVSDWQSNKFKRVYGLPQEKCITIRNASEPIEFKPRTNGKLKLIYTSTPWRGLELLVGAFKLLNRDDIELDVYSSTVIYGVEFMKNKFDWLFDRCRNTKGINYKGYATNKAVRLAVQRAHIFAYPSVFEETSCLSAIEAGMAGCRLVLTDYGALPETCSNWAAYTPYCADHDHLLERYTEHLNNEINSYWHNYHTLEKQSLDFATKYNWEARKLEWINLIQQLKE